MNIYYPGDESLSKTIVSEKVTLINKERNYDPKLGMVCGRGDLRNSRSLPWISAPDSGRVLCMDLENTNYSICGNGRCTVRGCWDQWRSTSTLINNRRHRKVCKSYLFFFVQKQQYLDC